MVSLKQKTEDIRSIIMLEIATIQLVNGGVVHHGDADGRRLDTLAKYHRPYCILQLLRVDLEMRLPIIDLDRDHVFFAASGQSLRAECASHEVRMSKSGKCFADCRSPEGEEH